MDPINLNQTNESSGGKGSLVGAIIVVILLIIGAIYLLSGRTEAPTTPIDEGIIDTTGSVDDLSDLENAADDIDVNGLDSAATDLEEAVGQ